MIKELDAETPCLARKGDAGAQQPSDCEKFASFKDRPAEALENDIPSLRAGVTDDGTFIYG